MAGFHLDDTIAAVSTAMAPAGIGIVRISGNDAFEVADRVFRAKKEGKKLSAVKSHTIHYGWITEGEEVIDEVLVMVMKGPKTYTGENTVEIDCHGGVLAVKKVLEAVLNAGARAADPGEFTKRAFLNGRMDLTQAEAVMDVISAKSAYALKSSESQLRGTVKKAIRTIREKLIYEIAFIESALDDPEHISLDGYPERLAVVVAEQKKQVEKLLASADEGKMIQEGIKTVILGKPNAGKSSLLNLLAGEEVYLPVFDFKTGKRSFETKPKKLGENDILVIEGIHCLNPKLTEQLCDDRKFRIYISALTQLNIDEHNRIPSTDGRLIRRLVRDARTRGASATKTISMWPSVRRGEEKNIFPYQEYADVMFNSSLIYELAVLKQFAEPLLFQIDKGEPEYYEAKRLLKFLEYFLGVTSESLPNNSLCREFVGGSCFNV